MTSATETTSLGFRVFPQAGQGREEEGPADETASRMQDLQKLWRHGAEIVGESATSCTRKEKHRFTEDGNLIA